MYSRKLGVSDENTSKSLESFNERLREQYAQKRKPPMLQPVKEAEDIPKSDNNSSLDDFIQNAKATLSGLNLDLDFDSVLLLGIIVLILTDANPPDLVLIGILASLIF